MDPASIALRTRSDLKHSHTNLEIELYYLIVRFLSAGPCSEATQVLRRELLLHQVSPDHHQHHVDGGAGAGAGRGTPVTGLTSHADPATRLQVTVSICLFVIRAVLLWSGMMRDSVWSGTGRGALALVRPSTLS
ncbi:Bromodomain and WD repeat-containing protein 3 [Portunus trituberculatus]|uniref:Bromodomain and WD repeat-containing protein 3 n=1 Tax=Portunus trituberculatus TaxID=210409 RepID=A0A5B7CGG1_PORTR|nr:Bromodomain and WD repeat-containing protein 3 [Portunus trituberculatus]